MAIIVDTSETKESPSSKPAYPYLGIDRIDSEIVLFISKDEAVSLGFHKDRRLDYLRARVCRNEEIFDVYQGTIALRNE